MRFSFLLARSPSTPHTYIHVQHTHTHPSSRGDMHSWYTVYAIEYTYCRRDPILHLTLVHVQSVPRINDVKKTDDDNDSNHLRQTRDSSVVSHTWPVLYHLRWFPRFLLQCVSDLIINNRPNIANTDDIWKDVLTLCSSYRLDLSLCVCLHRSAITRRTVVLIEIVHAYASHQICHTTSRINVSRCYLQDSFESFFTDRVSFPSSREREREKDTACFSS